MLRQSWPTLNPAISCALGTDRQLGAALEDLLLSAGT